VRPVTTRRGRPDDADAVLAMLDGAVRWLASTGRSGQWGPEPFSAEPGRVAQVRAWAAGGGLRIAEAAGVPVGAMVVDEAPAYVPVAEGPEVYVLLLVASRAHAGRRVGAALLRRARARSGRAGRDAPARGLLDGRRRSARALLRGRRVHRDRPVHRRHLGGPRAGAACQQ